MKCKVVIFEQDQNYQNHLLVALREKFADLLDVIPCSESSDILKCIERHHPDLLVINERIEYDLSEIPEDCAVACFTEFRTAEKVRNKPAVCKYQKVKEISSGFLEIVRDYKAVLAVKREEEQKAEEERLLKEQQEREEEERRREEERIRLEEEQKAAAKRIAARRQDPDVLVFLSSRQGNGSAVAAAACAINAAERGLSVLSLGIRPLKHQTDIFTDTGKDGNLKELTESANREELTEECLEQNICTDISGADYFDTGSEEVWMAALEKKGFLHILSVIGRMAKYDAIILNIDSSLNAVNLEALKSAAKIIMVGSGTGDSNAGIEAFFSALKRYDEYSGTAVAERVSVLYNKFINLNCTMLSMPGVDVIGGINLLDVAEPRKISENMAKMMIFNSLVSE